MFFKFLISLIFFISFLPSIYSISGTDSESYDNPNSEKDGDVLCPCDKTEGVCDIGCCCDTDCFELMLSNDFFSKFECDESSFSEKNKYTKLDYCDDYKESVDDLYNPLVLAFKILKRGFCAVKKNEKEENEQKDYDKKVENYQAQSTSEESNDNAGQDIDFSKTNNYTNDLTEIKNFEELNIYLPISLPNGLCLFHSFPLRKNIDYEVTCSYDIIKSPQIVREFSNGNPNNLSIHEFYYDGSNENLQNSYLKKVEIICNNEPESNTFYTINHYYGSNGENNNNNNFVDLTVDVKFVKEKDDFKLSGNPGYIKGNQLIFGINEKNNDVDINKIFNNGGVFPIQKSTDFVPETNPTDNRNIYFDNYMDNKITFEDLLIYGFNQPNYITILDNLFSNDLHLSYFGNAKRFKQITNNQNNQNNQNFVLIGEYKDSGTVNNTQYQIYSFGTDETNNNLISAQTSYNYFIVKFIKLETDTKWYYAPGPVIIKLPRNIMYPFRIGTSKYN